MTPPTQADTDLIRRRVINVVGHELRTPITTVRGLAELLDEADDDEVHEIIIPALIRNARRSEELLDDLLIVSEIKTAHPVDAATSLDLGEIARTLCEDTVVRVVGEPAALAHGHREMALRGLQHLVSNAVKYHEGQPTIRFENDDETVSAVVVTPVSTALPDVELTFEVFFRGEAAVTRAAGLGIGLPAARAMARVDGGDVTVESTSHEFVARFSLPLAEADR